MCLKIREGEIMPSMEDLCLGCMKEKGGKAVCPHCGYEETEQKAPALALRTLLQKRYLVGKLLSSNGAATSYLGWDESSMSPVVIREFFPTTLAQRGEDGLTLKVLAGCEGPFQDGLDEFLKLSRILGRMRNQPAVVPVYDIFEINGTAYNISGWEEGVHLDQWLPKHGGHLSWDEARALLMPVLYAVEAFHSMGALHLGICPQNLVVTQNGRMQLAGFHINQVHIARSDLTPVFYPGYTALEQMKPDQDIGPWSDVYGLGATLFTMLTGYIPKDAVARQEDEKLLIPSSVAASIPQQVAAAMAKAMRLDSAHRTKTVEQMRKELSVSPNVTGVLQEMEREEKTQATQVIDSTKAAAPAVSPSSPSRKEKEQKKWIIALGISSGLLFVLCVVLMIVLFAQGDKGADVSREVSSEASSMVSSEESSQDPALNHITPTMVGREYEDLMEQNPWSYVEIELAGEVFDDSVPEGTIAKQEPEPDTPIETGETVKVYLSKGPYMRKVPNVRGKSAVEAILELTKEGFSCQVVEQSSDTVPDGQVIQTDPPSKEEMEYGSEVFVYVSDYNPPASSKSSSSRASSSRSSQSELNPSGEGGSFWDSLFGSNESSSR